MTNTANPAGELVSVEIKQVEGAVDPFDKPEEFAKFEDLTQKLTKVSKAELDEKRKTT